MPEVGERKPADGEEQNTSSSSTGSTHTVIAATGNWNTFEFLQLGCLDSQLVGRDLSLGCTRQRFSLFSDVEVAEYS